MSNISPEETISIPEFSNAAERALSYPYPAPDFSYTMEKGIARQFFPEDIGSRTPLLAIGSNISPMQLKRKYGTNAKIPVQRAWLLDHDVVFAQRFAPYGAIPAMLSPSAGTMCFLAVLWLNDPQMEMMDKTEYGGYTRGILKNIHLRTQEGDEFSDILYYRCLYEPLQIDGQPVAITDIIAEQRTFAQQTTSVILSRIFNDFQRTFSLYSFQDFLAALADNDQFRAEIERRYL